MLFFAVCNSHTNAKCNCDVQVVLCAKVQCCYQLLLQLTEFDAQSLSLPFIVVAQQLLQIAAVMVQAY
jgi:hypothetical protein